MGGGPRGVRGTERQSPFHRAPALRQEHPAQEGARAALQPCQAGAVAPTSQMETVRLQTLPRLVWAPIATGRPLGVHTRALTFPPTCWLLAPQSPLLLCLSYSLGSLESWIGNPAPWPLLSPAPLTRDFTALKRSSRFFILRTGTGWPPSVRCPPRAGRGSTVFAGTYEVTPGVPAVTPGLEKHEGRPPRNTSNSVTDRSVPSSGRGWGLAVHGDLGVAVTQMSFQCWCPHLGVLLVHQSHGDRHTGTEAPAPELRLCH